MSRSEISNQLSTIFSKIFSSNSIEITDDLIANDVDNWDSLTHMLLISEIEDHFKIKFKLRELNKMKNVGVLIDLIDDKIN